MKKLTNILGAAAMLAAVSLPASAATYIDHDPLNRSLGSGYQSYSLSGWFTITGPSWTDTDSWSNSDGDVRGYVPGTAITSAYASFELESTDREREIVDIDLGSSDFLTTTGNQVNGTVAFGDNLTVSMIADLQSEGAIRYTVTLRNLANNADDVGVNWARLVVTTADSTSVPDGGTTVALLGTALLGLVAARRRFSRK
jgi:hypothetical protein